MALTNCINNISSITELLTFNTADEFYHLQIIKRKKEHPELGSNSYIVKTYYITSVDRLLFYMPEIICLCNFHNARACINLNRRSFEKTAYHTLKKVTDQIMNRDFKSAKSAYDSVCGTHSSEGEKLWIVDIDNKDKSALSIIQNDIMNCEPNRRINKVVLELETKNGFHLITKPFNVQEFKALNPDIDIHKNNHTILYMPLPSDN